MHWYRANKNVFSRHLKAASVEFGLRSGSGRLFQADEPAIAKSRWPYGLSRWRGSCSRFRWAEQRWWWWWWISFWATLYILTP